MRPLALSPTSPLNAEFVRRVAAAINLLRAGAIPDGCAIPYNGTTPPEGYTTAAPGPVLSAGWIWITPIV